RPAIRRQAHELVFAVVHLEAAIVGERGVEQSQRVRKIDAVRELDLVSFADAERRRAPFADAVEREDGGLVERAWKEGAGRMTLMMLGEENRRLRFAHLVGRTLLSARSAARQAGGQECPPYFSQVFLDFAAHEEL